MVRTARPTPTEAPPLSAFDDCFREWFPTVARAMALIVGDLDQGREIAQEGFVRLFGSWSGMSSLEHTRNFVFRTSINLARSHLRRQAPLRFIGLGASQLAGSVADESERSNDRVLLADALERLSRRQRECVVLVDYVGHDAESAGSILALAPPTVRVHLARGRAQLRKHLSDAKEER
jgi:RNA polymerase sigma-70 factor, ECF subfamily